MYQEKTTKQNNQPQQQQQNQNEPKQNQLLHKNDYFNINVMESSWDVSIPPPHTMAIEL